MDDFMPTLDDAINNYLENGGNIDDVISALELKLMGLKEEIAEQEDE